MAVQELNNESNETQTITSSRQRVDYSLTVGKRSGIVIQKHIPRDSLGFEDIDAFWQEESPKRSSSQYSEGKPNMEVRNSGLQKPHETHILPTPEVHSNGFNTDQAVPQENLPSSPAVNISRVVDTEASHTSSKEGQSEQHLTCHDTISVGDSHEVGPKQSDSSPGMELGDNLNADTISTDPPIFGEASPIQCEDSFHHSIEIPKSISEELIKSPVLNKERMRELKTPLLSSSHLKKRRRSRRLSSSFKEVKSPSKSSSNKGNSTIRSNISSSSLGNISLDDIQTDLDETFRLDGFESTEDEHTASFSMDLSRANELLEDEKDDDNNDADDNRGCRRSKRKRFKPLKWYKGEHVVYERKQKGVGLVIPTVVGVERVGTKTPAKHEKKPTQSKRKNRQHLPKDRLPEIYQYNTTNNAMLWDEHSKDKAEKNIIYRNGTMKMRRLPEVEDNACALAGQSFNLKGVNTLPGWISGVMELPPGSMKEPECVWLCTQVFYIISCQPGSVEVAFARPEKDSFDKKTAQRFLVASGDEFYVPPNNTYMLRNHSSDTTCTIRFMIIKPTDHEEQLRKSE